MGVECGGSNVQMAVNPADGEVQIIEMNPRVSRSSAVRGGEETRARVGVFFLTTFFSNLFFPNLPPLRFRFRAHRFQQLDCLFLSE